MSSNDYVDQFVDQLNDQLNQDRLRVAILFRQTLLAQGTSLLNAAIFCFITKDYVSHEALGAWLALVVFIFILRNLVQYWFRATYIETSRPFDPKIWEQIFVCGTFLSGLAWALAGTWLLPAGILAQHAFLSFLLAGTTAGACVAYCISIPTMLAFLLPAVLPFALKITLEGNSFHYAMAMLCVLYVGMITVLMIRMNRYILESISLRFEKDKLLKELRATQSKITQAAKMSALGEMAGGIAHEINTPLGTLQFEVDTLAKLATDEELGLVTVTNVTGRMSALIERISKIITGLKVFASDGKTAGFEPVLLQQIVSDTLDFCRSRFGSHGIDLKVGVIPPNLRIFCQSVQIRQVLLNILNNAFEAARERPNGKVQIEVHEKPDEVLLVVADNGHGIPPEIHDKIMQPFFTTKQIGEGPGLGLSVSRGFIQSHGGRLEFESSVEGTRFIVALPKDANLNAAS